MLLPAVDRESYDAMFALSRRYPAYCRPMMGLHPTSVNGNPDYRADLDRVAEYLQAPPAGIRFCGVGEIGLDFYWSRDFREQQMQALRFQIELALAYDLPVAIHTRDAFALLLPERVVGIFAARGAQDREPFRQQPPHVEFEQRRHQLAPGQVARCPEDDE